MHKDMEKFERNINIEKERTTDFEELRSKVELIKKEEMAKKERGEFFDIYFEDIDPKELSEESLNIFSKFLNKTLTREEFSNYQVSGNAHDSQINFKSYLANKLQYKENLEWFDPDELRLWREMVEKRKQQKD